MKSDYEKDYDEKVVPKHKKKSSAKGQPRADHKHIYEQAAIRLDTVILNKPQRIVFEGSVCTICGRISNLKVFATNKDKTQKEIWDKYPHYYINDLCDKNAIREELSEEPDVTCPNCFHKTKHQATWGEELIYSCPNCLFDWKAYKNEKGNIRITERFFFG